MENWEAVVVGIMVGGVCGWMLNVAVKEKKKWKLDLTPEELK